MRAIRRRLSYANVVATLALGIAVAGGTAYAANTVFSSDIVNGEVKSVDIGTGQVRTPDIGANQVDSAKVADGTLNGSDVADQGLNGIDILESSISSTQLASGSVGAAEVLDESIDQSDLQNGGVSVDDLATNSVVSSKVINGSLDGSDVGEAQFIRFDATFGNVSPQSCSPGQVTGLPNDARDHLVLTEASATTNPFLVMSDAYSVAAGTMVIRVCNLQNAVVAGGTHTFNLLVIDAQ